MSSKAQGCWLNPSHGGFPLFVVRKGAWRKSKIKERLKDFFFSVWINYRIEQRLVKWTAIRIRLFRHSEIKVHAYRFFYFYFSQPEWGVQSSRSGRWWGEMTSTVSYVRDGINSTPNENSSLARFCTICFSFRFLFCDLHMWAHLHEVWLSLKLMLFLTAAYCLKIWGLKTKKQAYTVWNTCDNVQMTFITF